MKIKKVLLASVLCASVMSIFAQNTNCFLEDFAPKKAIIPNSVSASKTVALPTVTVTLTTDTLGKISKYIFGNAIAVWMGNDPIAQSVFVKNTQALNPSLIRFPGGSWSDIFFWNGTPTDVPDSVYNGTTGKKDKFYANTPSTNGYTTLENYYRLRQQTGSQGLITINYAYARYGLSSKPVLQAAHLAADWVRYDNGRTKFWEIGNENNGPWEDGWMIDLTKNKDGQPQIITGQLYGQHCKIIADSMRVAATEIGAKIYIGGQVLHYDGTTSWNNVDKTWNSGFFKAIGDGVDFYAMHNYFGAVATVDDLLSVATTGPNENINFIQGDIFRKRAFSKPVALTEYNMNNVQFNSNPTSISYINGIQAVILFNELIKNNFGLAARWLLLNSDTGMFYDGIDQSLKFQPRPDFYYAYFQQKFTGDHVIPATSDNADILSYASRFGSGETGVIIVNKGKTAQVVKIDPVNIGVGNKYYTYTLTGGTDNGDFSLYVSVNGVAPSGTQWGPRENLEKLPAKAMSIDGEIKVNSPGMSVQFIMVDAGTKTSVASVLKNELQLTNYPNPFSAITTIQFKTPSIAAVSLGVFDLNGKKVSTLINEMLPSGTHQAKFDGSLLPGGVYFYQLKVGEFSTTQKMILIK